MEDKVICLNVTATVLNTLGSQDLHHLIKRCLKLLDYNSSIIKSHKTCSSVARNMLPYTHTH